MEDVPPLELVTIPISHYCEKARWALERADIPYRERRHVQGIHRIAARRAGGGSTLTKQEVISFGTQLATAADADPPKTRVWLGLTDETGASQSFPIDTFTGTCSAEEGGDMGALGTLRCWWAGAGVNLIAVARGAEVIVLRQWVEEQQDEPLDYEELQRIQVTYGAKVVFQL